MAVDGRNRVAVRTSEMGGGGVWSQGSANPGLHDGRPLAFKTVSNTKVAIQCVDKYSPIMNDWQNCPAVERDPERVSGAWIFRGTRVPVRALFENLEDGATVDDFLEWFPGVQRAQVEAVLKHAERSLLVVA